MAEITKEQLEELYINQGLTIRECAKALGLPTSGGISWRLKKFGIKARPARFQKGNQINKGRTPKSCAGWKGGKQTVLCDNCGKELRRFPSLIRVKNYCNHICKGEAQSYDMAGKRIGILTVIKKVGRDKNNHILWECLCDCGNKKTINTSDLSIVQSCGCEQNPKGEASHAWKGGNIKVNCAYCGKEKEVSVARAKAYEKFFCHDTNCKGLWMSENLQGEDHPKWVDKIEVNCAYCGKALEPITPSRNDMYTNHFCDVNCQGKWISENKAGKNNPNYKGGTPERRKIGHRISAAMHKAIRQQKAGRHWEELVDYNLEDLTKRLKSTLPDGYSWEDDFVNGKNVLHLDHIVPMVAFNFESPEDMDFKRCFALDNLQLLPAIENMHKSAKLEEPFQPCMAFG